MKNAAPSRAIMAPREKSAGAAQNSRERLLDAATRLFAQFGYEPVSTSTIASAAGLTQSMVNYHFKSKINLWRAAVDRLMHERSTHFWVDKGDLRDLDPLSQLKVLTRRFMLASAHDPYVARIAVHEAVQLSSRLDWLIEKYVGATYRTFDRVIEDAMSAGIMKILPVGDVTTLIMTAATMPFVADAWSTSLYGYDQASAAHRDSYIDTTIDIIFSGLSPGSVPLNPSLIR